MAALSAEGGGARLLGGGGFWGGGESSESLRSMMIEDLPLLGVEFGVALRGFCLVDLGVGVLGVFRGGLGVWGGSDLALTGFGGLSCRLDVDVDSNGGLGATPLGGVGDPLSAMVGLFPAIGGTVGVSLRILIWIGGPSMGDNVPSSSSLSV